MKIKILGCGNASSTVNGNNCILLEENDDGKPRRMLIDAGWDLPHMLKRNNIDLRTIDDIYISHAHADHVGGLEYVAFNRYDWANTPLNAIGGKNYLDESVRNIRKYSSWAPNLIANSKLMQELWDYTLKGGMRAVEGLDSKLETFFVTYPIKPYQTFLWVGWVGRIFQQIHIKTSTSIYSTFGLMMSKPGHKTVYFVTDSQHCSSRQQELIYKQADIIFQDCELLPVYTGVHANYEQLAGYEKANSYKLSPETKEKMYLTHYQDFYNEKKDFFGNDCDWDAKAAKDGFAGFVRVGQEFII